MKKDNILKQAARWVARMFGYKAENKFAKAVWYVFATSASVIALFIAAVIVYGSVNCIDDWVTASRYRREKNDPTYLHDYNNTPVSPYVVYHDYFPSYLYNMKMERRTLTDIRWVCKSSDGDSLVCYCTNGKQKRGYFNRFTGEEAIPAQYQRAWVFSEGLACVEDKGTLYFIDHKGRKVMDKVFPYTERIDDYCFHNGLCSMMGDNGRIGLINRNGDWKLEPEYSFVNYHTKGFWLVTDKEDHKGLLSAEGEVLLPCEYNDITVHYADDYIFVIKADHTNQAYDFDLNLVNSCHFNNIYKMEYETDEYDEYGSLKSATAHCLKYCTTDDHYGMMDRNGNVITPPYYSSITAIGPDRYHCNGPNGAVILDSKGRECGEKL